jgi:flagellar hook-basal body complex protein FliE
MIDAIKTISAAISTGKDDRFLHLGRLVRASISVARPHRQVELCRASWPTWRPRRPTACGRRKSMSIQAIRGEANTREVVDAVMNAQQSLQTAIAIRDKVVSAYLEVARMPI